jgi:regulator of RNase E activity RraA
VKTRESKMNVPELIEGLQNLYSGAIADALDKIGYREQVMKHEIKPLFKDAFVVGRAVTAKCVQIVKEPENPWKVLRELIEELGPGDVVVVETRETRDSASWGELVTTAAISKGCVGVVVDGCVRDSRRIVELQFPVFCVGVTPADDRYRTDWVERNIPIRCGGVVVRPGDIVFGDCDGAVIIPIEVAEEVITLACEKIAKEDSTREGLKEGLSITEVYDRYKVL